METTSDADVVAPEPRRQLEFVAPESPGMTRQTAEKAVDIVVAVRTASFGLGWVPAGCR